MKPLLTAIISVLFVVGLQSLTAQLFPDNGYTDGTVTVRGQITNIAALGIPPQRIDQALALRAARAILRGQYRA